MKRLSAFLLCSSVVGLAGCAVAPSHAPSPAAYPSAEQHKMQAAHHWDVLAEKQAAKILEAIKDKSRPVYVERPGEGASPFEMAYYHQLREHLVEKGGLAVEKPMVGGVKVDFLVQVVVHKDRDLVTPSSGLYIAVDPTEVLITTRVLEGNLVTMTDTDAFYYNPGDTGHYLNKMTANSGRTFLVVGE